MNATAPHVLLAEDEPLLAASLKLSLEHAGLKVTIAHDGWSALHVIRRGGIDVLVTDYQLPGLTGSQLCFILRDGPSVPPVIMITGKDHELDIPWLRQEHNLIAILLKPVKPTELSQLIASCCPASTGVIHS